MANIYKYVNRTNTELSTQNYTIPPYGALVFTNSTIPELDRIDGTLVDKYLNGEARQDPDEFNYYQPVISNEQGDGIKLNIDNPQFGWHDLLSPTTPYTGPANTAPTFNEFVTDVHAYQFKVGDKSYHQFHIPHDYAPGTDMYIHVHWLHNNESVLANSTVIWEFASTYAKGYEQQAFNEPKLLQVSQVANQTPLMHHISEIKLTVSGGSATQLDTDQIETDGLIIVRTMLHTNGTPDDLFMLYTDLHYQSTGIPTKNKNYNFWI
jgi:hypothetical protein